MSAAADLLVPRPQHVAPAGSDLVLGKRATLSHGGATAGSEPAVERLLALLRGQRIEVGEAPYGAPGSGCDDATRVRLGIDQNLSVPVQGYRLNVDPDGIDLFAADGAGLFYAVMTLAQWLRLHRSHDPQTPTRLPGVRIEDRPDFLHRGVLLDISRNRVPTMKTLFRLVDLLASWKINQLQLYTEHTFAYVGHEAVWRDASPMTPDEIRHLDEYCRERFVELVPNQNSLGHFHRWLIHEPYRSLAECPDGIEHPFSRRREPFSLCPTDPKSLALLSDLYAQLLPNFSSRLFNVGLDETFDVGKGRSSAAVARGGRAGVYLDFFHSVHRLAADCGKRIQFWGDMALEMGEMIEKLPMDAIALDWGYEAHHPFATETAVFADAGLDFYVCPGTSSWNSLAGRGRNAVLNLASAALAGRDAGALGYLVTDWGDNGHLQTLPASYPGFLAGAAFAWNRSVAHQPFDLNIAALLDTHVFDANSPVLGRSLLGLSNLYLHTGSRPRNGTVLFHLLASPSDDLRHPRYESMRRDGLEQAAARAAGIHGDLAAFRPASDDQALVRRELLWTADALGTAARLGIARIDAGREVALENLPRAVRRARSIDVDSLLQDLPDLWLARSREGGLTDSAAVLGRLAELV